MYGLLFSGPYKLLSPHREKEIVNNRIYRDISDLVGYFTPGGMKYPSNEGLMHSKPSFELSGHINDQIVTIMAESVYRPLWLENCSEGAIFS
jgi:hypothetical protein